MRSDLENAMREFGARSFGNQKNIDILEAMLSKDEKVLFATSTNLTISSEKSWKKKTLSGFLLLTDKRILFSQKVLSNHAIETIMLGDINTIACSGNGITGGHIEIAALTKSYDILLSYKKEYIQKVFSVFETARENFRVSMQAPNNTSATSNSDILSQVEKMADLFEKGIISKSEFESKKSELLSRL